MRNTSGTLYDPLVPGEVQAPSDDWRNGPRLNTPDLVTVVVQGQIAHPVGRPSPYRVGHDGVPRILPGSGGIVLSHRIGDRCVGLAGDHVEPGVSLHNNTREIIGEKNGPNLALLTYACVGNTARVVSGPCRGETGMVTGKHGGVEHVIVDFPGEILLRLRIGDRVQIASRGLGLRLIDHPEIEILNCSPRLARRWGLISSPPVLQAPVTHLIPASVMGSGIGRNEAVRGDYDIQLFDPEIRRRFRLDSLRFGDFVAIIHSDSRYGRAFRHGVITVGVVVHGDSTVSGHGPGVLALLTGKAQHLRPMRDTQANLARVLGARGLSKARAHQTLIQSHRELAGKRLCAPAGRRRLRKAPP
jgi:hypothetical protein